MITLAREPFATKFQSRLFSISTCSCVLIYFAIVVIPFVLVFASENFWTMIVHEEHQMNLQYLGNYYIQVTRANSSEIFTNMKYQAIDGKSAQIENTLNGGSLSFLVQDFNSDGLTDHLSFDISLNGAANDLRQLIFLVPIQCSIPDLRFTFLSYLYFQELETIANQGLSQIQITGNAELYQAEPIPSSNFEFIEFQNVTVSSYDSALWLDQLIREQFTNPYQLRAEVQRRKLRGNDQQTTTITIELHNHKKHYIAKWVNLMATLKLAWLQYMSVFLFVWVIGREGLLFLFRFRILSSTKSR